MKLQRVLILATATAMLAGPAPAADFFFYVNPAFVGAPTGACDAPFVLLADAIAAAKAQVVAPGDRRVIRMASGTYNERALTIDFSDVVIEGGYDPTRWLAPCDPVAAAVGRDPITRLTVVDGQTLDRILDIECERDVDDLCITANTGIVFDGLVFRNGRPARPIDPIDATRLGGAGGAMLIVNAEVAITNSVFEGNSSRGHGFPGGAIYLVGYYTTGNSSFNSARLDLNGGNTFRSNTSGDGAAIGSGSGGAIFAVDFNESAIGTVSRRTVVNVRTTPPLAPNEFLNNIANGAGAVPTTPNCVAGCYLTPPVPPDPNDPTPFCENPCTDDGDGDNIGLCYRPLTDCNGDGTPETCTTSAGGGAMFLQNISGTIDGARFEGNIARGRNSSAADFTAFGGAIAMRASASPNHANPIISNSTFVTNTAQAGAGSGAGCGWYNAWGGAVYGGGAGFDGILRGNEFRNNRALGTGNNAPAVGWGGAVMIWPQNQPIVDNNRFIDQPGGPNQAVGGGNGYSAWGGGLSMLGGQPIVTNNLFRGNVAQIGTAGVPAPPFTAYGGGMMGLSLVDTYPVIAGNTFENNQARNQGLRPAAPNPPWVAFGGGALLETGGPDGIVSDNIVRNNTATALQGPLAFAGLVLQAEGVLSSSAPASVTETRVQNNLIVGNQGIGLTLFGDRQGTTTHLWSGTLYNNTIAANSTLGLLMNRADDTVFDSNIIYGNDPSGAALQDVYDEFLTDGAGVGHGDSAGVELLYNDIGVLPAEPPDFLTAAQDGLLASPPTDWVNVDPQFVSGMPGRDHYLRQPGEQGAPFSPLVDATPVRAASRDFGGPRFLREYDLNADTIPDLMSHRSTRSVSGGPDLCFLDVGFHYQTAASLTDTDGDGVPDSYEDTNGNGTWDPATETDFGDRDTDNDGVIDGEDCGGDVDGDGTPAALDCDADGDGLTDGLELGVTIPDADTVSTADCMSVTPCGTFTQDTFTPDASSATRTDPLDPDTDGSGEWDGCEDVNRDGACSPCGLPCQSPTIEQNPTATLAGQADDDADGDCMQVSFERTLGLDPADADTDDDGLSDGAEYGFGVVPPPPPEAYSEPLQCDTDGDTLADGLERSATPIPDNIDTAVPPRWVLLGTDLTTPCASTGGLAYVADSDTATQTFTACSDSSGFPNTCEGYDTDGDTCPDGEEDATPDGFFDVAAGDETDPWCGDHLGITWDCNRDGDTLDPGESAAENCAGCPDCIGITHPLRMNEDITSLTGGAGGSCGPLTQPPVDQALTARGSCVQVSGCVAGFSVTESLRCTPSIPPSGPEIGTDVTIAGGAVVGLGCRLAFIEVDGCDYTLWVRKAGNDLVLQAQ